MSISVKKGVLWRGEIDNAPGTFAKALEPFARENTNLQIVMGYTSSRPEGKGIVELFPVSDSKSEKAAAEAGLHSAKEVPCLILEGDDKPGLMHKIAQSIARANINLHFAMCQSVEKKFQACLGFANDEDAEKAEKIIKEVSV